MNKPSLMDLYFPSSSSSVSLTEASTIPKELPIKAKDKSKWKLRDDPERLIRIYRLPKEKEFKYFIQDLLELQQEESHHARITIQYPQIKIELWTHDLKQVTESDIQWAEKADRIYNGYK